MSSTEMNSICFAVLLMLSVVECNDFCQEFRRNNYKIDYGYEHQYKNPAGGKLAPIESQFFVVIGHKYWRIKYNESENSLTDIQLETQSETSEWFGSQYRLGFSFYREFGSVTHVITGLMRKSDSHTEWGVFDTTTQGLLQRANRSVIPYTTGLSMDGLEGMQFNQAVCSSPEYCSSVFIISNYKNETGLFEFDYAVSFGLGGSIETLMQQVVEEVSAHPIKVEPIAQFFFYKSRDDIRYLYLFQKNSTIKYCLDEDSCGTYYDTLVDCPPVADLTTPLASDTTSQVNWTTDQMTETSEDLSTINGSTSVPSGAPQSAKPQSGLSIIIIIVIICAVVILVLIVIVILYVCSQRKRGKASFASQTLSDQSLSVVTVESESTPRTGKESQRTTA